MSSNIDRYRNLKERGRLTPRSSSGGTPVFTFSASSDSSGTRPKLNHKPGQIHLASPYKEEPQTVQTAANAWESVGVLGDLPGEKEIINMHPAPSNPGGEQRQIVIDNLQKQETIWVSPSRRRNSPFDPATQQRYEEFKGRVRRSTSRDRSHQVVSDDHRDDQPSTGTDSIIPSPHLPHYATPPEALIYPPSVQKIQPPNSVSKLVSPSQRSAFRTPRKFTRPSPAATHSPTVFARPSPTATPPPTVLARPSTTVNPSPTVLAGPSSTATPSPPVLSRPSTTANPSPNVFDGPSSTATPSPTALVGPSTTANPSTTVFPGPSSSATPSPTVLARPSTAADPSPTVFAVPSSTAAPSQTVLAGPSTTANPSPTVYARPSPTATPSPTVFARPSTTATPSPTVFARPSPTVMRSEITAPSFLHLPAAPSICASNSLSSHQFGSPNASVRRQTPEDLSHHYNLRTPSSQESRLTTPPLRAYATPSPQRASPKNGSQVEPFPARRNRDQARNRSPPGIRVDDTPSRPALSVDTQSTPTSKPPPLDFNGATAQHRPRAAESSSKSSETSSQTTTSTGKRDRLMDIRQATPQVPELPSRPPLVEHSRPPIHDAHNRPSTGRNYPEPQAAIEFPSRRSSQSDTGDDGTPVKTPLQQQASAVSPLDFYRQMAAEKTRQVIYAKQTTQPTPTRTGETMPSKQSIQLPPQQSLTPTPRNVTPQSPIVRGGDSPSSLPNYRCDPPKRLAAIPMLDQRTVRILYSQEFDQLIEEHIQHQTKELLVRYSRGSPNRNPEELALYARKRPLLEDEAANKEFDVINAETGHPNAMTVYVTSMLSDFQTKDVHAHLREFDHVFSEFSLEEDVYLKLARPEVARAQGGGLAAIVVFGHSESGKSHNILEIEERAAYDLFGMSQGTSAESVSVQFLEFRDMYIVDLLAGSQQSNVRISEEAGRFRVEGSTTRRAGNPRELLRILSDGRRRLMRSSSDRTEYGYILCQLTVNQKWANGYLSLLECPSSELMDANSPSSTFRGLMDRIRLKAEGKIRDHPFRGLNLVTKAMQHIFDSPRSKISILTTVSPAASCTEETLAALDVLASAAPIHVMQRQPQPRSSPPMLRETGQENVVPKSSTGEKSELCLPRLWDRDELIEWMARKHLLGVQLPYDVDGRKAMRMTKAQLLEAFYNPTEWAKADRLHQALRAENDRIARMRVKARMAQERERAASTQVL